jgi:hypothetical protein
MTPPQPEQPRPRPRPIVYEPDTGRITVAAHAVLARYDHLHTTIGQRPRTLAYLHAADAIRADDDHGRTRDLVTQADELRWTELLELARTAETHLTGHPTHPHGDRQTWHHDCPTCQATLAIARIRAHHHYRAIHPTNAGRPDEPG